MYRNHFSKKSSNFKTVRPKAAAPGGAIKPSGTSVTKVEKINCRPKTHSNSINPTMIKSVNYEYNDDNDSYAIVVDLYDNIEGKPLDYVMKTEEADSSVAVGFDNTLLIPIYYPAGNPNDDSAKPHIDELQNMYQWLLMSKDLKTTDPTTDPKDYKDQVTYCLRLHSDTRTIVKEPVEGKIEVDLSVVPKTMKSDKFNQETQRYDYKGQTYPVKKYLNGENYATIDYPVVWLGFYEEIAKDGTPSKPKFLRCYLEDCRASELYISAGSANDGVYTPAHVTDKLPAVEIITGDSFSYYPDHATFVNCQKDGNFVEDNNCSEIKEACIPGYEIIFEEIRQDCPDCPGTAIVTRPLQYAGLEATKDFGVMKKRETDLIATEKAIFTIKDKMEQLDVAIRRYADKDFEIARPLIAFAYEYADDAADWIDPEHHEKGRYLKKLTSQAICANIKYLKGFHIKGPIDVYQIVNGQITETVCKLRYLNEIELEDCLLEDEKGLNYDAIEYFWLYNVILSMCDNQMKYYKVVNDKGVQIIGEDKEGQMVGENGEGILKPMFRRNVPTYGTAGYNPTGGNMWFDSLDDLYGWLTQKHRISLAGGQLQAPEIVLPGETTIAAGFYTMKVYAQDSKKALYYHPGKPSKLDWTATNGKPVTLVYEVTKAITNTKGSYDTVQFHLCWEAESTETEDFTVGTKKYCDTYYGLVGSDYFGELSDIFLDVVKVETEVKSSNDEILSVISPNRNTRYPGPEEMTAYLTKLKNILERVPINTRFVGEAAAVVAKYVLFENTRMPSFKPGDLEANPPVEAKGLDKNHPSSVAEATTDMAENNVIDSCKYDETLKKYIGTLNYNSYVTQQFYCEKEIAGIKDGEYIWTFDPKDDEYSHMQLLREISGLYEVLNWTCMGSLGWPSEAQQGYKKGSVEEELYVATKMIIEKGILYYGQAKPVTKNGLTVEMINDAELEIYEEEAIYQVHYAKMKDNTDIVVGLSINGTPQDGTTSTEPFIKKFLTEINKDLVNYLSLDSTKSQGYTLSEFVAYLKPLTKEKITVSDRNKLIEYSQMLNTIQGQRDFIQKKGDDKTNFLLKFQQTSKGTIFEILKAEGDNYASEEDIYGYYISQGYGYSLPSTSNDVIKVPKGRKEMRMRGSKGATPEIKDQKVIGRFRITRMPRYYEQEPICWRNDNYFSNQIYTLNADNLNTIIDPEFEAREKTIFTADTAEGSTTGVKEQEMIGFYTISVTEN